MTTRYPQTFPPDEAASWRRVRKYAVPRQMIALATERRLAGDWRGACAAANVDLEFDIPSVRQRHGAETAAQLDADLRYFAPDLLRWHLPRWLHGRSTLTPGQCVMLASYGGQRADGPHLHVITLKMIDGPQRLLLRFGGVDEERYSRRYGHVQDWRSTRHLWDTRQSGDLLERCGGGSRAPFRNADGTPRVASELPTHDPGANDPVGHAEWITLLSDRAGIEQACVAAGITLDDALRENRRYGPPTIEALAKQPLALATLEPEARRLAAAGRGNRYQFATSRLPLLRLNLNADAPGLSIRPVDRADAERAPVLPVAVWHRLPDLDLLRFGDITPEELHPLVSASLFPTRAPQATDGPPRPAPRAPAATRVRCRGEWHEVRSLDGRLRTAHSEDEERRERAMRAFGGPVTGCFAVAQAWTSGTGWLPKALRAQRLEFFSRVQQGDTAEVVRLLDAGIDPHTRDGRQRTLLHLLHLLDHETMLPRLLAAGLDLEARDQSQRTPLHVAVGEGPEALVRALLAAGARTDVADDGDRSLPYVILHHRRRELRFLYDTVVRDHPKLADQLYYSWEDLDDWEGQDDD